MQEIVKVATNADGKLTVSARELHEFLGVESKFNDWVLNQISKAMLDENTDYSKQIELTKKIEGSREVSRELINYELTLSSAKEIAMLNGGEKGKEARIYFIECEKKLKAPMTNLEIIDMLRMTELARLEAVRVAEEAQRHVAILTHTTKTYTATEIAKECGFRSVKEFNKELEERKIQFKQNNTWILYAKYAQMALVDIKQEVLDNGKVIYHRRFTGIGRDFLINLFN